MTKKLRPYPEYKDSGLPWLGAIPAHWEVRRNGRLFAERNETGFGDLPILEVSLRTGVRVRDFENSARKQVMSDRGKYKRAVRGDIAYNMMRMWQGAVGAAPVDGLVSPAYVVARPLPEVDSRYYAYLFRTDAYMNEVNQYSRGIVTDRNRLYWDEFKQMPSAFPPPDEQRAIANFLDKHGRWVRQYIRNKRRLIELLNEQKQAIIHQAVTRGIDPTVGFKPSGVEGLGEVPEHWSVVRLRHLVQKIDQGVSPQAEAMLAGAGEWGVLKAGCANGGIFRETQHKRLPSGFIVDPALVVKDGDVLVSRACGSPDLVGSVARVSSLRYQLVLSDKTFRLQFRDLVRVDFFVAAMNARYFRQQVRLAISGAEGLANNLPLRELKSFSLAVPPTEEARRIFQQISPVVSDLDRAIASVDRHVTLIREYRTRLITDVVTGQLDVRQLAPAIEEPSPDELEPLDEGESLPEDGMDPGEDLEAVEVGSDDES